MGRKTIRSWLGVPVAPPGRSSRSSKPSARTSRRYRSGWKAVQRFVPAAPARRTTSRPASNRLRSSLESRSVYCSPWVVRTSSPPGASTRRSSFRHGAWLPSGRCVKTEIAEIAAKRPSGYGRGGSAPCCSKRADGRCSRHQRIASASRSQPCRSARPAQCRMTRPQPQPKSSRPSPAPCRSSASATVAAVSLPLSRNQFGSAVPATRTRSRAGGSGSSSETLEYGRSALSVSYARNDGRSRPARSRPRRSRLRRGGRPGAGPRPRRPGSVRPS